MITPAQLERLIAVREIWIQVGDADAWIGRAPVAAAREDDGWIYLASGPILNEGPVRWQSPNAYAGIFLRNGEQVGGLVEVGTVQVPVGRALIVSIGLRVATGNPTAHVVDPPTCRWAQTPGPCEHGCPIPLQYPCTRERGA